MAGVITRGRSNADDTRSTGTLHLNSTSGVPEARVEGVDGTARWAAVDVGPGGGPRVYEDFLLDAGATLPLPWGKQDTSAAGSPTLDFTADGAGGLYVMKLDTTNEVENITLYFADQLVFNIAKNPVFSCRLKIESDVTGAGGLFAAGDMLAVGLASARNATLDSVATHAWFRFEGANHNILYEGDDGTTDTDDQDSGVDWAENTFVDLKIDATDLASVKFYVNEAEIGDVAIAAATGNVPPFIQLSKAAAANKDHRVTVDWIDVRAQR
jgi:hypothetical protein